MTQTPIHAPHDDTTTDEAGPRPFTDQDRQVLELERSTWKWAGAKAAFVREWFGWSETRYFQVVGELLDHPEAEAWDPVTVHRLRRLREQRQVARSRR